MRLLEWLSVAQGRRWMIHHMGDVWVLVTSTETCQKEATHHRLTIMVLGKMEFKSAVFCDC